MNRSISLIVETLTDTTEDEGVLHTQQSFKSFTLRCSLASYTVVYVRYLTPTLHGIKFMLSPVDRMMCIEVKMRLYIVT